MPAGPRTKRRMCLGVPGWELLGCYASKVSICEQAAAVPRVMIRKKKDAISHRGGTLCNCRRDYSPFLQSECVNGEREMQLETHIRSTQRAWMTFFKSVSLQKTNRPVKSNYTAHAAQ